MNSSHPCLSCFKSCRNVRVLTTCSTFSRKVTGGVGGGGTWVIVCWVCAAGLSEPLPHYSLLFGQL